MKKAYAPMQKHILGVALQDCERWSLPLQVPTLKTPVHPSQEFSQTGLGKKQKCWVKRVLPSTFWTRLGKRLFYQAKNTG